MKELKYSKTLYCLWWLSRGRNGTVSRQFELQSHRIRSELKLEISQLLSFPKWGEEGSLQIVPLFHCNSMNNSENEG